MSSVLLNDLHELKIRIDLDEARHVPSTVGSSVDLPTVLWSFGPLTINTPPEVGASSATSHW